MINKASLLPRLVFASAFVIKSASAAEPAPPATQTIPGTAIALPRKSEVSVQWVVAPLMWDISKETEKTDWDSLSFEVDNLDRPWLGDGKKSVMINLLRNYLFLTSEPFSDFAWLDEGGPVLNTDAALGILENRNKPGTAPNGLPLVNFKARVKLPYKDMRIYGGGADALYVTGENPKNKIYEVYRLKSKGEKTDAILRKIFESKLSVSAVAGDGEKTFIAAGRLVSETDDAGVEKPQWKLAFLHPNEEITSLAYSKEAGLFYATASSVGYLGKTKAYAFMTSPKTRIRARGQELYIFLGAVHGVVKVTDIAAFKEWDKGNGGEKADGLIGALPLRDSVATDPPFAKDYIQDADDRIIAEPPAHGATDPASAAPEIFNFTPPEPDSSCDEFRSGGWFGSKSRLWYQDQASCLAGGINGSTQCSLCP